MRLARNDDDKVIVRNYNYIKESGTVLGNKGTIDEVTANKHGYYFVSKDPVYDTVMQYLGAYEIKEGKAIKTVLDKTFGSVDEEKSKKIKELNTIYQQKISEAVFPWQEKASFGEVVPEEIKQTRLDLISECHSKELAILALTELREVIAYEL